MRARSHARTRVDRCNSRRSAHAELSLSPVSFRQPPALLSSSCRGSARLRMITSPGGHGLAVRRHDAEGAMSCRMSSPAMVSLADAGLGEGHVSANELVEVGRPSAIRGFLERVNSVGNRGIVEERAGSSDTTTT